MGNFYITCFAIVFFILVGGIFYSHVEGLKKAKTPVTSIPANNDPLHMGEQHRIATETELERKKAMDDLRFQIDKQMQRNDPAARRF